MELVKGKNNKSEPLRPFPLNPFFVSRPVLSEPLKEEIYQRVVHKGYSITKASDQFKITIERVAAVVRMKQMERDRLAEVSFFVSKFALPQRDDTIHKRIR